MQIILRSLLVTAILICFNEAAYSQEIKLSCEISDEHAPGYTSFSRSAIGLKYDFTIIIDGDQITNIKTPWPCSEVLNFSYERDDSGARAEKLCRRTGTNSDGDRIEFTMRIKIFDRLEFFEVTMGGNPRPVDVIFSGNCARTG